MAIQVRRGNEADFDASKMLPGELAVSLDARYVRMCFAPGIVLRMATYDSFEADMSQIKSILAECKSIQSAVQRIQSEVNSKASLTIEYANSAKQSADRAYSEAERAKTYANNAEAVTGVQIATKDRAGLIKGGDNHIAEDGTLMLITETTETTMPNSYDGRLLVKKIKGVCEQGENPSPTSPQEIKKSVVSGVKTMRSNWLDISKIDTGGSESCNVEGEGKKITVTSIHPYSGVRFDVMHLRGKSFYLVGDNVIGNGSYTIDLQYGSTYIPINDGTKITLPMDAPFARVRIISNNTDKTLTTATSVSVENLRIVESKDIPWQPYKESSFTFSNPIDLYGIGDVQDVIEDGKVKRRIGKVILNGTENYRYYNKAVVCNVIDSLIKPSDSNYVTPNILSERFVSDTPSNVLSGVNENRITVAISADTFRLRLHSDLLTSAESAVSYFTANNTEVIYELANEVIEELPFADQIALNSLSTYDGVTYLEFDSEIEPTFEGEYGTSKVGGYTLEGMLAGRNGELMGKDYANRITALETAMVNNI